MLFYIFVTIIALTTGTLTGLTGASGMSLLISGLMLLGVDIREIIALTFPVTLANSVSSAIPYYRRGLIDGRVAITVSAGAFAGVLAGYYMGERIPPAALKFVMLAALSFAGWKLASSSRQTRPETAADTGQASSGLLFAGGVLAGGVMGIMGGGGGMFIAIVLMFAFAMPAKSAVATSIVVMATAAAPGFALHSMDGRMRWDLVAFILPVSTVAAFASARWGRDLPDQRIKRLLGWLLLVIVVVLLLKSWRG